MSAAYSIASSIVCNGDDIMCGIRINLNTDWWQVYGADGNHYSIMDIGAML